MFTINIKQLKQMIKSVVMDINDPLMIWGQPGVGKSEAVAQVAEDYKAELVDVRLSQYDAVDMRGIPVPQNGLTVWNAPSTLPFQGNPAFPDDRPIILFLDEINAATPGVAAVAYQLINDRKVGEHVLKENVKIIAAGNREGDRGVTNRMPTPLANRFTHVEVDVDPDAWCEWIMARGMPAIGVAFIQFRRSLLSTFDPAKTDKAFATPRTWVKALKYFDSPMREDIKQAAMAGAIGVGPSAEFWGFVNVWHKMPDIKDIEANPKIAPLPDEPAMNYAVAVNISGNMNKTNADRFMVYLSRISAEFVVLAWQLAVRRDSKLFETQAFLDFSKKYKAVFTD